MKGKVKITNNWEMAYVLYKLEGVSYEIKKNSKGKIIFYLDDSNDIQNIINEWIKIEKNTSDDLVNLGQYIFYRNLLSRTIQAYKNGR